MQDLFTANVQRLAQNHGWMDAQSSFAIAQTAINPDEADSMASRLRDAKVTHSARPLAGYFDDGRLYEQPNTPMKVARYLNGATGPLPVAEQDVTKVQRKLVKEGYITRPVTGVWDSEWQAAMYEYGRDAHEEALSRGGGKGFTFNEALKWTAAALPVKAFDAIINFAKGLPGDVRHLAATTIGGVEGIGAYAAFGINDVMFGDQSFQQMRQHAARSMFETMANVENALMNDTTAREVARSWGVTPGRGKNEDWANIDDGWKWTHSALSDIGTMFLLTSFAKAASSTAYSVGKELGLGYVETANARTPGVIGRSLFGARVIRPAATMETESALPGAIAGTFEEGGAPATNVFRNIPHAAEELPVIKGKFGWHYDGNLGHLLTGTTERMDANFVDLASKYYKFRTLAATPYRYGAVRAAGTAFQKTLNQGILTRLVSGASEIGPGSSPLAEQIQQETWLDQKNAELIRAMPHWGPFNASIDNLMFFLHAPLHGAVPGVKAGEAAAMAAQQTSARIEQSMMTMGVPQMWERFAKGIGVEDASWESLVKYVGGKNGDGQNRAQRWVMKKVIDYVIQTQTARLYDASVTTEEAVQKYIAKQALAKGEEVVAGTMDIPEEEFASVAAKAREDGIRQLKHDLLADPELLGEAIKGAFTDMNNDDFVVWLMGDYNRYTAGRNLGPVIGEGEFANQFFRDANAYIDASDHFQDTILPILQSELQSIGQDWSVLNAGQLSAVNEIPILQDKVNTAKEALKVAKRAEQTQLGATVVEKRRAVAAAERAVAKAERELQKAYLEEQKLAEKERISTTHAELGGLEKKARAAGKAQSAAERSVAKARKGFVSGASTEERAVLAGITAEEYQAGRQAAFDEAANAEAAKVIRKEPKGVRDARIKAAGQKAARQYDVQIGERASAAGVPTSHEFRALDLGMDPRTLAEAEQEAIAKAKADVDAANKARPESEQVPWTKADEDRVRRELRYKLAESSANVRSQKKVLDKAIDDVSRAWDEVHHWASQRGTEYLPEGRTVAERFPLEARPITPLENPQVPGELTSAVARSRAELTAAEAAREAGPVMEPVAREGLAARLRGPEPLTPTQQANADYKAAQAALEAHKARIKQTARELEDAGLFVGKDAVAGDELHHVGIAGNEVVTQEAAAGDINEFEAEWQTIQEAAKAEREQNQILTGRDAPDSPEMSFEYDMLPPEEQAQFARDWHLTRELRSGALTPDEWAALHEINPEVWPDRGLLHNELIADPTAWETYSDAEREILRAAYGRVAEGEAAELAAVPSAQRQAGELLDKMLDYAFETFGWGREQGRAYASAKDVPALLKEMRNETRKLVGDVVLADHASPAVHDAVARLNTLGYKLVVGKDLSFLTVPKNLAGDLNWDRSGWISTAVANSGFGPQMVTNSTVTASQTASRLRRFTKWLSRADAMRPGVDSKSIEGFLQAGRSGKFNRIEGVPGRSPGQALKQGMSKATGWFLESERDLADRMLAWDNEFAREHGSSAILDREVSRVLQLRDMPRKKVVRMLTNQRAVDAYFGVNEATGMPRVMAWSEKEANLLFQEVVKSYADVPFGFVGLSNLDNLFRASATWITGSSRLSRTAGGAVLGGLTGAAVGVAEGEDLGDVASAAAQGAAVGAVAGAVATKKMGWMVANMPNAYKQAANTLRFDLSPMFSLRRVAKANLKMGLEGVEPTLHPLRKIELEARAAAEQSLPKGLTEWETQQYIEDAGRLAVEQARKIVRDAFPEMRTEAYDVADEAERYLRAQDVFNLYNGSAYETYVAHRLHQAGHTVPEIREKLIHIFNYGAGPKVGRSALERSANFVFFPLSFDKTLYRNVGAYLLDRPAQIIFMQQALATYDQFDQRYGTSDWVKKHLPILEQVQRLNAFEHGLSAGELGGVNAPLLQLFIPQSWRTAPDSMSLLKRFIPIWKDAQQMIDTMMQQGTVAWRGINNEYWKLKGIPDTFAHPYKSTIAPSEQLKEAYKYQTQLFTMFDEQLRENAKTRDPNRKFYFNAGPNNEMGKYAGMEVTKSRLRQMVADKFPAYDPTGAVVYMSRHNNELDQYELALNEDYQRTGNTDFKQRLDYFIAFRKSAEKFNRVLNAESASDMQKYQAEDAEFTAAYRANAIWLAKRDPRFYKLYQQAFQRFLGPLEKVD